MLQAIYLCKTCVLFRLGILCVFRIANNFEFDTVAGVTSKVSLIEPYDALKDAGL